MTRQNQSMIDESALVLCLRQFGMIGFGVPGNIRWTRVHSSLADRCGPRYNLPNKNLPGKIYVIHT